MNIMSFNTQHCLNFVTRKIDFQLMADTIKTYQADLVGLNEIRGEGSHPEYQNQTQKLSELTDLTNSYFAQAISFEHGPYGNALLSKVPILHAETILVPDPEHKIIPAGGPDLKTGLGYYETRCLLKAKLANGYTVLVIHFGLNPDEQENAVQTVLAHLEPEKCILMGDFNVTPDNPVLNPIRERMKDTASGFSQPLFSFPSDAPDRKIDYIFVSPDIEIENADIPACVASDHRPHIASVV